MLGEVFRRPDEDGHSDVPVSTPVYHSSLIAVACGNLFVPAAKIYLIGRAPRRFGSFHDGDVMFYISILSLV